MLSYQHMYHAGCLADVHKHLCLSVILNKMAENNKAMSYIETHAGRGIYDLSSAEAKKTGEAEVGICKILAQKKLHSSHPYHRVIAQVRAQNNLNYYPGSPYIAKSFLRAQDTLHLMELHPKEFEFLKRNIKGKNITIHKCDGYSGALSALATKVNRGIVLIDPSYEIKSEYDQAADFIKNLHRQKPEISILLWYPILSTNLHYSMCKLLTHAKLSNFWQQEVFFKTDDVKRAIGSGLIAVNLTTETTKELDKDAKDIFTP